MEQGEERSADEHKVATMDLELSTEHAIAALDSKIAVQRGVVAKLSALVKEL